MQTGGPHTLVVRNRGGEARTISDILIGDVYLCAGQSNMELPLAATLNSGREIARATDGSCCQRPGVVRWRSVSISIPSVSRRGN